MAAARRAPRLVLVIGAALTALAAAAPARPQTTAAPTRPVYLTPAGYGPARIGMTRAQVAAALDTELQGEPIEPDYQCIEMTATRGYPGLVFMFLDDRLSRIAAVGESRVTTARGIGLGATAGEVRLAYGAGLEAEPHPYLELPAEYLTFWVRREQSGVRFETDLNRRVDSIIAGNDSIRYIEGCA